MELKEGMYVRTKDGTIDKITKDENGICSCPTSNCVYCEHHILATFIITKASYNIIDLIEVGDYVNGYRVDFVENIDSPIITIKKVFCEEYTKDLYSKTFNIKDIKSIVTHEQMESMSYKVGE